MSAATITACRGRAGARRRSGIREHTRSTTPIFTPRTAAAPSARASAWCTKRSSPTGRGKTPPQLQQADGSVKNVNLLAEGSYSKGSEITDGYPEFTYGVLKKLGWDKDLTEAEKTVIERIGGNNADGVSWSIDLSGGIQRVAMAHGCIHYGNGKARANAFG